jgi:hypothetical protein
VAIFVSERRAISALHVFTSHYGLKQKKNVLLNRDIAIYGILHRPEEQKENVQFRVVNHNNKFDLVVLELDSAYSEANYSLALPAVNANRIWKEQNSNETSGDIFHLCYGYSSTRRY